MDLIGAVARPERVHRPGRSRARHVIGLDARMHGQRDVEVFERATDLGPNRDRAEQDPRTGDVRWIGHRRSPSQSEIFGVFLAFWVDIVRVFV